MGQPRMGRTPCSGQNSQPLQNYSSPSLMSPFTQTRTLGLLKRSGLKGRGKRGTQRVGKKTGKAKAQAKTKGVAKTVKKAEKIRRKRAVKTKQGRPSPKRQRMKKVRRVVERMERKV